MEDQTLIRTDLNLLVALQVLLEEGTVSRAAERLFVTQSAMSKTLARLRELFDDPLFTRAGRQMVPTPKALELGEQLKPLLEQTRRLVAPRQFDPGQFRGELSVAVAEFIGMMLMPRLMARLEKRAPFLRIRALSRVEGQLGKLASGELDVAIQLTRSHYGPEYRARPVGAMPPSILVREGHPLVGREDVSWDMMEAYPRVVLYIPDSRYLQVALQDKNFVRFRDSRRGIFETTHLMTALEVVRKSDYLMAAPPYIAHDTHLGSGLATLPWPEKQSLNLHYMLVRHQRSDSSAIHRWLEQEILDLLQEDREELRGFGFVC